MSEEEYFSAIGATGRVHASTKPFSDGHRAAQLAQVGAVVSLLPEPPARVLECGCGAGWLTKLLAMCGFGMTGIDIAPDAISLARANVLYPQAPPPDFLVGAVEDLQHACEFDAALFYDSLHHVADERRAMAAVLRALRPGGLLITSEPGAGHEHSSRDVADRFGVRERDMPARHIRQVALDVGFSRVEIFPRLDELVGLMCSSTIHGAGWKRALRSSLTGRIVLAVRRLSWTRMDNGIVVCHKRATSPG